MYKIAMIMSILVLAACKEDSNSSYSAPQTSTSEETNIGPYMRIMPITGRDTFGVGIGVELAPGIHADFGTGNINFGLGY
jgi:hypothetical protein